MKNFLSTYSSIKQIILIFKIFQIFVSISWQYY